MCGSTFNKAAFGFGRTTLTAKEGITPPAVAFSTALRPTSLL